MPLFYATITESLLAMARGEHDDLSIGEEAAAEIERLRERETDMMPPTLDQLDNQKLRAEIERLRAALQEIGNLFDSQPGASAMAREALKTD